MLSNMICNKICTLKITKRKKSHFIVLYWPTQKSIECEFKRNIKESKQNIKLTRNEKPFSISKTSGIRCARAKCCIPSRKCVVIYARAKRVFYIKFIVNFSCIFSECVLGILNSFLFLHFPSQFTFLFVCILAECHWLTDTANFPFVAFGELAKRRPNKQHKQLERFRLCNMVLKAIDFDIRMSTFDITERRQNEIQIVRTPSKFNIHSWWYVFVTVHSCMCMTFDCNCKRDLKNDSKEEETKHDRNTSA